MTRIEAINQYVWITQRIAELRGEREKLKLAFATGRNLGDTMDVMVSRTSRKVVNIPKLRQLVMPAIVTKVLETKFAYSTTVVEKTKVVKLKNPPDKAVKGA